MLISIYPLLPPLSWLAISIKWSRQPRKQRQLPVVSCQTQETQTLYSVEFTKGFSSLSLIQAHVHYMLEPEQDLTSVSFVKQKCYL